MRDKFYHFFKTQLWTACWLKKTVKKVFANTRRVCSRSAPNNAGHKKQDDSMLSDGFEVMFHVLFRPLLARLFLIFERKNLKTQRDARQRGTYF